MAGGAKKTAKFVKAGSGSALGRLNKKGKKGSRAETMIQRLLRGKPGRIQGSRND